MNIFDMAITMASKQGKWKWDAILDNAIKIRKFLDNHPAVVQYALTGEGSKRVQQAYEGMIK